MTAKELEQLVGEIYLDGVVTENEVKQIWDVKESEEDLPEDFENAFIKVNMDWLSTDGKLDEEESAFLIQRLNADDYIDDMEAHLLETINRAKVYDGLKVCEDFTLEFPEYFN